jgi:hypothetical protein
MPVTPTGSLSLALTNLRTLMANCQSWREWCSGDPDNSLTVDQAMDRVFLIEPPPPANGETSYTAEQLTAMRPFARVDLWMPPRMIGGEVWISNHYGQQVFVDQGKLSLEFEDNYDEQFLTDPQSGKLTFLNDLGKTLDDLKTVSGSEDFFNVTKLEMFLPVRRSDEAEVPTIGDRWIVEFIVEYGT